MAYAYVQLVSNSNGNVSASTISLTLTPTAGNLLVYFATIAATGSETMAISDTNGASYQQVASNFNNVSQGKLFFGFSSNVKGGSTTITATCSAPRNFLGLMVAEYSGLDAFSPYVSGEFAQSAFVNPGTGTDAISTGNVKTLLTAPAAIIAIAQDFDANNTPVAGTGFTSRLPFWTFGAPGQAARLEDRRLTGIASTAATFTSASGGGAQHYFTAALVLHETATVPPAQTSYAFIQQMENTSGSTAVNSQSVGPMQVHNGNSLIYATYWNTITPPSSIALSDTFGLNWHEIAHGMLPGNAAAYSIGYTEITQSGLTAITASLGGGQTATNASLYVGEYFGLTATPFLSGSNAANNQTNPGTAASAITSGNITPQGIPAMLFGLSFNTSEAVAPLVGGTNFIGRPAAWSEGGATTAALPEDEQLQNTATTGALFNAPNTNADNFATVGAAFQLVSANPPPNSYAYVQQASNSSTASVSTLSATLPNPCTAGNMLVVYVKANGTPTISITDSGLNTYTPVFTYAANGITFAGAFAPFIAGGHTFVTLTLGTAETSVGIAVMEYSGLTPQPYYGEFANQYQVNPGTGSGAVSSSTTPIVFSLPAVQVSFTLDLTAASQPVPAGNLVSRLGVWSNMGGGAVTAAFADGPLTATGTTAGTWTSTVGASHTFITGTMVFHEQPVTTPFVFSSAPIIGKPIRQVGPGVGPFRRAAQFMPAVRSGPGPGTGSNPNSVAISGRAASMSAAWASAVEFVGAIARPVGAAGPSLLEPFNNNQFVMTPVSFQRPVFQPTGIRGVAASASAGWLTTTSTAIMHGAAASGSTGWANPFSPAALPGVAASMSVAYKGNLQNIPQGNLFGLATSSGASYGGLTSAGNLFGVAQSMSTGWLVTTSSLSAALFGIAASSSLAYGGEIGPGAMFGLSASTSVGFANGQLLAYGSMFGTGASSSTASGSLTGIGGLLGVAQSQSVAQITAIGQEGFQPLIPQTPTIDVRLDQGYLPWTVGPDDVPG